MSSQFAVKFTIPVGFPEVLKDFTREVLRAINMDQTCGDTENDIYTFADGYFSELATSSATPNLSEVNLSFIHLYFMCLFVRACMRACVRTCVWRNRLLDVDAVHLLTHFT